MAPLQVFDDGRQMWLQFAPGAAVPAIFSRTEQGDSPLSYDHNGPYVVLQGVWPVLVLRGGSLQSFVERIGDVPDKASEHIVHENGNAPPDDVPGTASAHVLDTSSGNEPGISTEPVKSNDIASATVTKKAAALDREAADITVPLESEMAISPAVIESRVDQMPAEFVPGTSVTSAALPLFIYEVSPADQNIRLTLMRWAGAAGWTFGAAHWTVDVDIPIVGSARFDTDFKQAVRTLLASTELAATPLQACFYSNKVLRIIAYAQACDRTANRAGRT